MNGELALAALAIVAACTVVARTWIDRREQLIVTGIDRAYAINAGLKGQTSTEIAIELGRPRHQVRDWLAAEGLPSDPEVISRRWDDARDQGEENLTGLLRRSAGLADV